MGSLLPRVAAPFLFLATLGPARADVRIVGFPAASGSYPTIQSAVNAALDGDLILVESSSTPAFTVIGKSLSIVAWPDRKPKVQGMITVRDLAPGQSVVLQGLESTGESLSSGTNPGLQLINNTGLVRVQACDFTGGTGIPYSSSLGQPGGHGARVQGCARVSFQDCMLRGGGGSGDFFEGIGGRGGSGLFAQQSTVVLYDCLVRGGPGGMADSFIGCFAGDGGSGVQIDAGGVFAASCTILGADGGCGYNRGDGGDGVLFFSNGAIRVLGCRVVPGVCPTASTCNINGQAGNDGLIWSGSGIYLDLNKQGFVTTAGPLAPDDTHAWIRVQAQPGDRVRLFATESSTLRFVLPWNGYAAFPPNTPTAFDARVASTGELTFDLPLGPQSVPHRVVYVQALVEPAGGGQPVLSSPIAIHAIQASLTPDCDGNGRFDACDLLRDGDADLNRDGLLDACDSNLMVVHVDANAGSGGNGTAGNPYSDLATALAAAPHGATVQMADGTYSGPANANLTISGRSLRLRGENGSGSCLIDMLGTGPFLSVQDGSSNLILEGISITNGVGSQVKFNAGALSFKDVRLFSNGSVTQLVDVLAKGRVRFDRVRIDGNSGSPLVRMAVHSSVVLLGCNLFDNNVGVGFNHKGFDIVDVSQRAVAHQVSRCSFIDNRALTSIGAAVHWEPNESATLSRLSVDNCLFSGNRFSNGASLIVDTHWGSAMVRVDATTFAGNQSNGIGSVLAVRAAAGDHPATAVFTNCIAWANVSGNQKHVSFAPQFGSLFVESCDFQGGTASVDVGATGTLSWGAHNLDVDPLFVDVDGADGIPTTGFDNDLHLTLFSPCLDAGNNPALASDALDLDHDDSLGEKAPFDIVGHPRRVDVAAATDSGIGKGPLVDLGAFEHP